MRPFHQKSTRLTQLTLGPYAVQIWSRNTLDLRKNETLVLHRVASSSSCMKLSTAQVGGLFLDGEASHISEFRTQREASGGGFPYIHTWWPIWCRSVCNKRTSLSLIHFGVWDVGSCTLLPNQIHPGKVVGLTCVAATTLNPKPQMNLLEVARRASGRFAALLLVLGLALLPNPTP